MKRVHLRGHIKTGEASKCKAQALRDMTKDNDLNTSFIANESVLLKYLRDLSDIEFIANRYKTGLNKTISQ
jgi:hypothetical protein